MVGGKGNDQSLAGLRSTIMEGGTGSNTFQPDICFVEEHIV